MKFKCPKCGETDPKYIGYRNGEPYCRRCILFKGEKVVQKEKCPINNALQIKYSLTKEQYKISAKIVKNYIEGKSTLIKAVCGAGKTELVYGVINYALSKGQFIGFAIPRRDVVIELADRLKHAFPSCNVASVYGGHHNLLCADILVLTTHQLFRYERYFDLLIMDEVDAFPFAGDPMLLRFSEDSTRGTLVMMSATPEESLLRLFSRPNHEILELNTRYHHHALPVPCIEIKLVELNKLNFLCKKLRVFHLLKKPVLVFAPTISLCEELYKKIKNQTPKGNYVHSKRRTRANIIQKFKNGEYSYLITTAVLERGVTIKNLQVIIYDADSDIYSKAALVQISGRAGRKFDAPEGEVIYLSSHISEAMEESIKEIETKNLYL